MSGMHPDTERVMVRALDFLLVCIEDNGAESAPSLESLVQRFWAEADSRLTAAIVHMRWRIHCAQDGAVERSMLEQLTQRRATVHAQLVMLGFNV